MPQLIFLAAAGVAVWFGYKAIKKEMARVGAQVREAEKTTAQGGMKEIGDLEKDPDTGVYKPKD
ncbi:MAG: hypothetical protein AAF468_15140 [Pseudomonadota bacterium]